MNASSLLLTAIVGLIFSISTAKAVDTNNCTDAQQSIGPIITPCRSEIILQKGQNYTLSCKGKSELQFKQQDIPEEVFAPFFIQQRTATSSDPNYPFETFLDLYNINQFAVGFYACYDKTVNVSNILNNLTDEPNNTQHISFIYIYVNGSDNIFAPMREVIISRQNMVLIECRPTTPDVNVSLFSDMAEFKITKYSPKIGYFIDGEDLVDDSFTAFNCDFVTPARRTNKEIYVRKHIKPPPEPMVSHGLMYFLKGESFSLNCTVQYDRTLVVNLEWKYPESAPKDKIISKTNSYDKVNGMLYLNITVVNASREYSGDYTCISSNSCGDKRNIIKKQFLEEPFIKLNKGNGNGVTESTQSILMLQLEISAYPPVEITVFKNDKVLNIKYPKYKLTRRSDTGDAIFTINNTNLFDTANYTLIAKNKYLSKNMTFDVRIVVEPNVTFGPDKKRLKNTNVSFMCHVTGYTLPKITWIVSNGEEQEMEPTKIVLHSLYEATAYLNTLVRESYNITCKASNSKGSKSVTRSLLVYEIQDGFGITDPNNIWFSQNENVELKCIASIYDYSNVTWLGSDGETLEHMVVYNRTKYSYVAVLKINEISLNHAGNYTCLGITLDAKEVQQTTAITVAALQSPVIWEPATDRNEEYFLNQTAELRCQANGVPPPKLEWRKDEELLSNYSNVIVYTTKINETSINSTVIINKFQKENQGKYECVAMTDTEQRWKYYKLTAKEDTDYTMYLSSITVIIFALIVLVVYLTWKIKKEKKFRKELAAAGLLYFKEGAAGSLNPERGIDEQAELLPYDDKFEFPAEKLILGKQLGAGAFGVVYKAEARGMSNAEETTVVAVKMVKKTADNMYIKALASELKIMVHLGKHVNIVNLLGACTKNVGKRELIVIVEYCKFGNIHNYMQKHREVFIDQLTDNKEKILGKVNRGFSSSTGSAGVQSDYFTSANTQDTDHTFVNTANSQKSVRKAADNPKPPAEPKQVSEGYIQPEWRSNYESDYIYDCRNPRPLTSRDLLAWAFQIARGMEYLASRKVLHGDLAARNVLLAEDNVVKICDFGLARSIYKNDEYQKKENSPLPVKWLAIECMADRIFSTQSDVWSFGIVLWELFSLAKTPYPNISPPSLLQWLSKGYRLEKPPYADDRLYEVMTRCWQQKPHARPSFSELQELLGTFLEDNVRNHYVDLNSMYMAINTQQQGEQDYLDMVCAPDYNNVVTPSPHHYVNMSKSFFPSSPLPLDEDGYLQVSPAGNQAIFSPRSQNATFDFDARKFNSRASEASSGGSELTPMLTLNNLPARSGSESDHEGATFPYSNAVCPRIDEETDEVFETKQNNAKNAQNNIAVSNPTYAFDVGIEKKPKDIINDYVNMNIPNGLVK